MKAIVRSIGGVGSRVRLGGHDMVFDQPSSVPGGRDRGPSPLGVMALAVAACAHYYATAYLYGRSLPTDDVTVEIDADKERLPLPRLGRLSLKVHVPAGLDDRQIAGIAQAIRNCPAYGTLLHPPTVEFAIEREPVGEAQPA